MKLIDAKTISEVIGTTPQTVRRMIRHNVWDTILVGKRRKVIESSFQQWVKMRTKRANWSLQQKSLR